MAVKTIKITKNGGYWQYISEPLVAGDVQAYRLRLPIAEYGNASRIKVSALRADGVTITDSAAVSGDTAMYTLRNSMYAVEGDVRIRVALIGDDGSTLTTAELSFRVLEASDENGIAAEDRYPILTKLLIDTQTAVNSANEAGSAARAAANSAGEAAYAAREDAKNADRAAASANSAAKAANDAAKKINEMEIAGAITDAREAADEARKAMTDAVTKKEAYGFREEIYEVKVNTGNAPDTLPLKYYPSSPTNSVISADVDFNGCILKTSGNIADVSAAVHVENSEYAWGIPIIIYAEVKFRKYDESGNVIEPASLTLISNQDMSDEELSELQNNDENLVKDGKWRFYVCSYHSEVSEVIDEPYYTDFWRNDADEEASFSHTERIINSLGALNTNNKNSLAEAVNETKKEAEAVQKDLYGKAVEQTAHLEIVLMSGGLPSQITGLAKPEAVINIFDGLGDILLDVDECGVFNSAMNSDPEKWEIDDAFIVRENPAYQDIVVCFDAGGKKIWVENGGDGGYEDGVFRFDIGSVEQPEFTRGGDGLYTADISYLFADGESSAGDWRRLSLTFNDVRGAWLLDAADNFLDAVNYNAASLGNKVDAVSGKGLSANDYTTADKNKLAGIEENANNYTHPENHSASMIEESEERKFMTSAERTKLAGVETEANNYTHPESHPAGMITTDSEHRFVTDAEKAAWNALCAENPADVVLEELQEHKNENPASENGAHGVRAIDGKIEIFDGRNYIEMQKAYKTYGVSIDLENSDPASAVTYTDAAIGMTAGSDEWDRANIFRGIRPCLFKDGEVIGYLDPNNFTKYTDGTDADISSGDAGDVMIEIPKLGVKIATSGSTLTVQVTDDPNAEGFQYYAHTRETSGDREKVYIGAFLGYELSSKLRSLSGKQPTASITIGQARTFAQTNGDGYDQIAFYQLTLLQCLFLIRYKSRDTQTALGLGYVKGSGSVPCATGGSFNKGMNFGEKTGKYQIKFLGIEDFWGNLYYWLDGLISTYSYHALTATDNFNDSGLDYVDRGQLATSDVNGYMKTPQGTSELGFVFRESGASSTTYFSDFASFSKNGVTMFGGQWNRDLNTGAFSVVISASKSASHIGARLMYL